MKKAFAVIFLLFFVVFSMSACTEKAPETIENKNFYKLNLVLNEELSSMSLYEEVTFYNNSEVEINEIVFHLYANAYRKEAIKVAYFDALTRYGGISINSVTLDGVQCETPNIYNEQILKVKCLTPLKPQEKITIGLDCSIDIPRVNLRFGEWEDNVNLANFYPILAVFENGAWREDAYTYIGDPFYSETSDYEIAFSLPTEYTLAHSGVEMSKNQEKDVHTYNISCKNMRDVAFVAGKDMRYVTSVYKDTTIKYYYQGEKSVEEIAIATSAMATFSELVGEYPYEVYSLVETPFVFGGMEYPSLVFIADDVDIQEKETVIIHETAHQWFAMLIGSDSINAPWQDESLVSFLTNYYYELNGAHDKFESNNALLTKSFDNFIKLKYAENPDYDKNINSTLYKFNTNYEYSQVVYNKGALMFNKLYEVIGKKRFQKALANYYRSYAYKIASVDDFYASMSKGAGLDVKGIIEPWFANKIVAWNMEV